MLNKLQKIYRLNYPKPLFVLLLILIVGLFSMINEQGMVNDDGIIYLQQAYFFGNFNFIDAFKIFPWPFFSICIAIFHKLTGFGLLWSGRFVCLILFGIAVYFFLKIIDFLYKDNRIIFYGGLILLSTYSIVDNYLSMIIRDHGYWAGSLAGIYFYLKYSEKNEKKISLLWQSSFLIAALFRPEALIILVLIPLFPLFLKNNPKNTFKLKTILNQYFILIIYLIYLAIKYILLKYFIDIPVSLSNGEITAGGRLNEISPRFGLFVNNIFSPPLSTDNYFVLELLDKYPLIISFSFFISIFLVKWISGFGILGCGLLFYYFREENNLEYNKKVILFLLIAIFSILPLINFFSSFVLSKRYLILSWMLVMILISPILLRFFSSTNSKKILIYKFCIGLIIFLSILLSIFDSKKKHIELDAGEYIESLNLSNNSSVKLINSEKIAFYGGFSFDQILKFSDKHLKNTDWIIIKGKMESVENITKVGYFIQYQALNNKDQNFGIFILKKSEY